MEKNLNDECPICLDINGHNECILLECCDKYIHKDCFNEWMLLNINNNQYNKNICMYCYKSNKYIDDFINKNKNHQIININEQIVNNQIIIESNNIHKCYKLTSYLCITFVIIITIGSVLGTTLN